MQAGYMKLWVERKLWIWNESKDELRYAQGEILERGERDGGNEKEGKPEEMRKGEKGKGKKVE